MAGGDPWRSMEALAANTARVARAVLDAHDALRGVGAFEPPSDADGIPVDPDAWLAWHTLVYRAAYKRWDEAMAALTAATGEPTPRHPHNFRPLCERLIREGSET